MSKMVHFGEFLLAVKKVLPDRTILTGQKLVETAKIKNTNMTFLVFFKQCAANKTSKL